jgi:hypothetical protein
MSWQNVGPRPTAADFERFERLTGETVPTPVKWFLSNVVNGGYNSRIEVPVHDYEDQGESATVHEMFGIGHHDRSKDMAKVWEDFPADRLRHAWPLGVDPSGSVFMLMRTGAHKGQVRFMIWDEYCDPEYKKTYLVANNIEEFARMLVA